MYYNKYEKEIGGMKIRCTVRTERKSAGKTVKAPATLIITLIFIFMSVFTFTACGGSDSGSGAARRINSPCETQYLTSNKLEFESINTLADGTEKPKDYPSTWEYLNELTPEQQAEYDFNNLAFQGSYVQISGLRDKDVEAAVNEKIKNLYMENLERIPPYRGIMAKLGKNPEIYVNEFSFPTMSLYETMSCNNILSIVLNVNRQYVDTTETEGNGNILYLSYMETLNIDLNTGEEVPIEALFCDDIDGLAYMSDYTKNEISSGNYDSEEFNYFDASLRLMGQFDGIKPTQKYYLAHNGIFLIFDYAVPELSDGFFVQSILIPYTDEMAVTERFFEADKNIYESNEEPVKMLMIGSYTDEIPLDDYYNNIQDENITFSRRVTVVE